MGKLLDVSGQKFQRLTAIKLVGMKVFPAGQTRSIWQFKCDCGNVIEKALADIMRSKTKSCGCARIGKPSNNRMEEGEASFNGLFNHYKHSAKIRNYEFALTKDEFRKLTKSLCTYCGREPHRSQLTHKSANGPYIYNGVDRVNNKVGYVPSNVVPCCFVCNRAKGTLSSSEFAGWINQLVNFKIGAGHVN